MEEQVDLPGEVHDITVMTGEKARLCDGCVNQCDVPSDYAGEGTGCSVGETRNDGHFCPSGRPANVGC